MTRPGSSGTAAKNARLRHLPSVLPRPSRDETGYKAQTNEIQPLSKNREAVCGFPLRPQVTRCVSFPNWNRLRRASPFASAGWTRFEIRLGGLTNRHLQAKNLLLSVFRAPVLPGTATSELESSNDCECGGTAAHMQGAHITGLLGFGHPRVKNQANHIIMFIWR